MRQLHVNTLNVRHIFEAIKQGITLPPGVLDWYRKWQRRQARLLAYWHRNAGYPYASKRQIGIRGVNHPKVLLLERQPNATQWNGRRFGHLRAA